MARGIAIPVRASRGRVVLSSGAEQTNKIIILSMLEAGSSNPFHRPGLDAPIFRPTDEGTTAILRRRIEERFRRLRADHRAELLDVSFRIGEQEGDLLLDLSYRDMEEDRRETVTRKVNG